MEKHINQLVQPSERVDFFLGGQLQLIQSSQYFNVSVDAVLLAHFVDLPRTRTFRYLDFCTGNGIVPLLLSERTENPLFGIEIQEELVGMANRSLILNDLNSQITIIHQDLRDFNPPVEELYDIITCNPPYFIVEDSNCLHSMTSHAIARHEITLTLEDWISKAAQIMRDKGKLFFVHRPERLDEIFLMLRKYHFGIHRVRFIYPKPRLNANGILIEAIYRGGYRGVKVEPPIYVHQENNDYSPEMKGIYQHG